MLEEAYKLQAEEQKMSAYNTMVPHMKDSDRKRYFSDLERSSRDIIDLGKTNDDYSGLEVLKKELNG